MSTSISSSLLYHGLHNERNVLHESFFQFSEQENAKSHTAEKTKAKFEELDGVEMLPHPSNSLNLAPSD
ncbi:hypothetical protein KIN20_021068 [Parelaphostrongylus tenuis]|uniref:Uncharacterized protein n=1 Tax=Parelaphostrongylus tenuis TaxID=148309 RepID=A0AAD5QVX3_PARTN|nr:hypothetical protein KIN20_021068 [Parelaphostrongylus tenuis]